MHCDVLMPPAGKEVQSMITNNSCTVYRKGFSSGSATYERIFIPKAMLQDAENAAIKNNGMANSSGYANSTVIYIPLSSMPANAKILVGDIVVIGCCETAANESGYGEVCALDDSLTVISAAKRRFGSRSMQHIEVHCV